MQQCHCVILPVGQRGLYEQGGTVVLLPRIMLSGLSVLYAVSVILIGWPLGRGELSSLPFIVVIVTIIAIFMVS